MQFWLIAMACGCFQVLQAMTNGAAARAGIGAIWVGAISATVSAVVLVLVAVAVYRLPLPEANLVEAHGLKAVAGGLMGAFILAGLTFVAPRLGPSQTFILYFFVIATTSALIDGFGLLGTEAEAARRSTACRRAARRFRPLARPLLNGDGRPRARQDFASGSSLLIDLADIFSVDCNTKYCMDKNLLLLNNN